MEIERWEKIVVLVRRGVESESDVGVGVTLEVRLHRFKATEFSLVLYETIRSMRSKITNLMRSIYCQHIIV